MSMSFVFSVVLGIIVQFIFSSYIPGNREYVELLQQSGPETFLLTGLLIGSICGLFMWRGVFNDDGRGSAVRYLGFFVGLLIGNPLHVFVEYDLPLMSSVVMASSSVIICLVFYEIAVRRRRKMKRK